MQNKELKKIAKDLSKVSQVVLDYQGKPHSIQIKSVIVYSSILAELVLEEQRTKDV